MDVQYNSLPRQSFPTLVNNASMIGDSDGVAAPQSQQATPKQRTVAFGKGFSQCNSSYSTPAIHRSGVMEGGVGSSDNKGQVAAYSSNNVYHHQLILGQAGPPLKGFEKQRGFSVPNLGGASMSFTVVYSF